MSRYRILVVDDDPVQRALLSEILDSSAEPFDVTQAGNGAEAIAYLKRAAVDAVLLDKCMPDMDGDAVCRYIRSELHLSLLPIIMVTGSSSTEELDRSFASGANDFIRKPYSPIELLARLKSAVQNKRLTDQLDNAETILFSLARLVEAKDKTTGDHCSRLAHMASEFGRVLGLSTHELEALRRGGIMHDIGKLAIPDSILLKEGPLDDAEWRLMRKHTVIGAHLCEGLASMRDVVPIILHHHERWDGSGYPYRLTGEAIPLLARIFQIVDIYDALSTLRPYKQPLPFEKIVSIFEEETKNGWRDPQLVNEFLKLLRSDGDRLKLPGAMQPTLDEQIAMSILDTGVIDWHNRKQQIGT